MKPKLNLRTNSDFMLQKISKESCDEYFIFSCSRIGMEAKRVQPLKLSLEGQFPHWVKSLKLKQSRAERGDGGGGKAGDESLEAFCKCHHSPSKLWLIMIPQIIITMFKT